MVAAHSVKLNASSTLVVDSTPFFSTPLAMKTSDPIPSGYLT